MIMLLPCISQRLLCNHLSRLKIFKWLFGIGVSLGFYVLSVEDKVHLLDRWWHWFLPVQSFLRFDLKLFLLLLIQLLKLLVPHRSFLSLLTSLNELLLNVLHHLRDIRQFLGLSLVLRKQSWKELALALELRSKLEYNCVVLFGLGWVLHSSFIERILLFPWIVVLRKGLATAIDILEMIDFLADQFDQVILWYNVLFELEKLLSYAFSKAFLPQFLEEMFAFHQTLFYAQDLPLQLFIDLGLLKGYLWLRFIVLLQFPLLWRYQFRYPATVDQVHRVQRWRWT